MGDDQRARCSMALRQVRGSLLVVVDDTVTEAQEKRALLDSLVHPDSGLASLSAAGIWTNP